jgi:hypothetical protein
MNGILFSRSSNYNFQMAEGGTKNIHEYVGIAYSANYRSMIEMTGETRKKHFRSHIDICPLQKSNSFDYISTCARKGLRKLSLASEKMWQ